MSSANPNPATITSRPAICGQNRNQKLFIPTNVDNCPMWNSAVSAMHSGMSSGKVSGNYNQTLATCYRVNSDQVAEYGEDNVFDIEALQKGWSTASGSYQDTGNANCARSGYGIFDHDTGQKMFAPQTNTSNSFGYWQQLQSQCLKNPQNMSNSGTSMYRCYGKLDATDPTKDTSTPMVNGKCLDPYDTTKTKTLPSMAEDYQNNFSFISSNSGGSAAANFNFSCRDTNQMTFTQCKLPGWDRMAYDQNKGWTQGDDISCGQNPLLKYGVSPVCGDSAKDTKLCTDCNDGSTCANKKCNDGSACSTECSTNKGSQCSGNRPNTMDGCQNCCENCSTWTNDFNTNGLFSLKDAQDDSADHAVKCDYGTNNKCTLKDIIQKECDTHVCISSTVVSDSATNQTCKTCAQFASKIDMSNSDITFYGRNGGASGANSPKTVKYCGPTGIAATPSVQSNAPSEGYADPRECRSGGAFEGQCQGLLGCANMNGLGTTGNDCSYGLSYTGTDPNYTDPSTNCPNLFTLARQTTSNTTSGSSTTTCESTKAFDNGSTAVPFLEQMDKMTIPEGAWVTGYWNPSFNGDWSSGSGVCANPPPGSNSYVVQMGCGKYSDDTGDIQNGAFATTYSMDSDGNWTNTNAEDNCDKIPALPLKNVCKSQSVTGSPDMDGKTFKGTCTFTGLSTGAGPEAYQGYSFGFMPGYYNNNYKTTQGPCANASSS